MKNTIKMILMAAAAVFFCAAIPKLNVEAAGFDAAYYAAKYPDVYAAYGNDEKLLYAHYLNYGFYEHRYKNAEEEAAGQPSTVLDKYVDVDIQNQTVTLFVQGEAVLTSPCVTGQPNNGHSTPTGTFAIEVKIPGKRLVGPDWDVWVNKWMRFTGLCGLHDASWRGRFGGEIYKSNGSHGCVNLPSNIANQLYDMVDVGTPVIVH